MTIARQSPRQRWNSLAFYGGAGLAVGGCLGVLGFVGEMVRLQSLSLRQVGESLAVIPGAAFCAAVPTTCFWLIARSDRLHPPKMAGRSSPYTNPRNL